MGQNLNGDIWQYNVNSNMWQQLYLAQAISTKREDNLKNCTMCASCDHCDWKVFKRYQCTTCRRCYNTTESPNAYTALECETCQSCYDNRYVDCALCKNCTSCYDAIDISGPAGLKGHTMVAADDGVIIYGGMFW
jgi:hypothetical protein